MGEFHQKPIGYVLNRANFEKYLASRVKGDIKLNTNIIDLKLVKNKWRLKSEKGEVFQAQPPY